MAQQVLAIEQDAPAVDAPRGVNQPQDGKGGHALAGTAFANDGERLAGFHMQGDSVHGTHETSVGAKGHGEVLHVQQRGAPGGCHSNPISRFISLSIQMRA